MACIGKFDKVTDFAGGSNVVILALVTFGLSGLYNGRQIILTMLVTLWGLRLSGYLLTRILVVGADKRFDGIRENPIKFLIFWIIQMLWVYILALPVMFVNSPLAPSRNVGAADIVGAVVFAGGLLFEAVSDHVKFTFKLKNKGATKGWCEVGPWRISRHPNYFGEICLWWGAFIISASILERAKWIAVLTPLAVTCILLFVSGIPMLERSNDKKYGDDPAYQEYKRATPILVPGLPCCYRHVPSLIKVVFCCEFPFYAIKRNAEDPIDK